MKTLSIVIALLLLVSFRPVANVANIANTENVGDTCNDGIPNGWWMNIESDGKAREYLLIENGELRRFNTYITTASLWVSLSVQRLERVKWSLSDEGEVLLMVIKQPVSRDEIITRSSKAAYLSPKGDTLFYKRFNESDAPLGKVLPFDTDISHYVKEYSRKSDGMDLFRERVFLKDDKAQTIAEGWYASDDTNASAGWYLYVEGSIIKRYTYVKNPENDSLFIVCQMIPQPNPTFTYTYNTYSNDQKGYLVESYKPGLLVERYETESHTFYKYYRPAPRLPFDTTRVLRQSVAR